MHVISAKQVLLFAANLSTLNSGSPAEDTTG